MSNKIVPTVYRAVIDDVIASIHPVFDEFGVPNDVLHELQSKWESKIIASRVADFDPPQPVPPAPLLRPNYGIAYIPPSPSPAQGQPRVKTDPANAAMDARYALAKAQYALASAPLPGPAFPGLAAPYAPLYRLPQTDGPAGSEDDDDDDDDLEPAPVPMPIPRAAHPSLPQPAAPKANTKAKADEEEDDAEAINSDLDDSDTDNEAVDEEALPESDIVFCTYDKVQRVKNKWKCVLKDGMIHTGGKDYLFQKCNGEFEW